MAAVQAGRVSLVVQRVVPVSGKHRFMRTAPKAVQRVVPVSGKHHFMRTAPKAVQHVG